jgi:hypothetical protein
MSRRLVRIQTDQSLKSFVIESDGKAWYPAVITLSANDPETGVAPWALAYFCQAGFRLPRSAWIYLRQSCRIFGEVIPQPCETDLGRANCYVLVRATGILKRDLPFSTFAT